MKLYYLSNTSFSDCDINILHHLSKKYDITYGIIIPNKNANYSALQLKIYCKSNDIRESIFHMKYRYRDPRTLLTYIRILLNIINTKPDIIYITNFDQAYFNLLMLFIDRNKTIVALHDVISHSGTPFSLFVTLSRKILLQKFFRFLTFSQSQADILKKMYPKHQVNIIPLALKDFGILNKSVKSNEVINFLFFGNIKPYKGLDILLKSIDRLSHKYSSFVLTIAGRCSNWQEVYEPLIENKKAVVKHIRFIENDEIPHFFSKADYLILPYRDATQSGPLMIAFNYVVPVIASDIPGFHEFIDNDKTGYLFDPESDIALDQVLEEAILRSEQEYNKLLANITHFRDQNLSIEHTINEYDNLFQSNIAT